MRTSSIESAIKAIKNNPSMIAVYSHYSTIKGRCTVEQASRYMQEELGIWGESGIHYDAVVTTIEYMIANYYDSMYWEMSEDEHEEEFNNCLLSSIKSEEDAISDVYDTWACGDETWARRYKEYFKDYDFTELYASLNKLTEDYLAQYYAI